jgi:hypothetical protein
MDRARKDQGSALLIVTIMVVILSGLAGAYMSMTWVEHHATRHTSEEIHCRQAASSAVDRARRLLFEIREAGGSWGDILQSQRDLLVQSGYETGGAAGNPYEQRVVQEAVLPASSDTGISPDSFFAINHAHDGTVYNVLLGDDDDADDDPGSDVNDQVIAYITVAVPAELQSGEIRTVLGVYRAVVYYKPPYFVPDYAMLVNGNLEVGGNPSILGSMGSVHANGDLSVQGSVEISQVGSATGAVDVQGNPPEPAGGWISGAAHVPIPEIDPAAHRDRATWLLDDDGKVYDNTTDPPTLVAQDAWNGFTWKSGGWQFTGGKGKDGGDAPPPGAFYINGDFQIEGGGTDADPWRATFLVDGSIDMAGNARIVPYLTGVTLMARGDIKLRGNASSYPGINGLVAAHEQVDFAGTPNFTGCVVAENAGNVCALVDTMSVTGNYTLTYDGGLETFLVVGGTSVVLRSWDRYR